MHKNLKRQIKVATASVLFALICSIPAYGANLVQNGSFESPPISADYLCFTNSTILSWTSTAGAGHGSCYINDGTGGFPIAFVGSQFMYVNDFGDVATSVQQSLSLTAGLSYSLTFASSGLGGGTAGLNLALGTFTASIAPRVATAWQTYSYVYTPATTGIAVLKFTSATSGVVSIDAVSVDVSPVPEPSTSLLLAGGNRLDPPTPQRCFDRAMAAARLRGLGAVAVKDG